MSLNKSVISGQCPSCLIREEQVAHLLAKLKGREEELEVSRRAVKQLCQSLTVMQPEYEALKEKLEAVRRLRYEDHLLRYSSIGIAIDHILQGGE